MKSNDDRIKELELRAEMLEHHTQVYRLASVEALQQLAWCVGYFAGTNKRRIARALASNFAHIKRRISTPHPSGRVSGGSSRPAGRRAA